MLTANSKTDTSVHLNPLSVSSVTVIVTWSSCLLLRSIKKHWICCLIHLVWFISSVYKYTIVITRTRTAGFFFVYTFPELTGFREKNVHDLFSVDIKIKSLFIDIHNSIHIPNKCSQNNDSDKENEHLSLQTQRLSLFQTDKHFCNNHFLWRVLQTHKKTRSVGYSVFVTISIGRILRRLYQL